MGTVVAMPALGAQIDTGSDVVVRWDNTFKYSDMVRVAHPSSKVEANGNFDDGDRSFKQGLVSNRGDWLSELDVTKGNIGMRVSGAAWYDTVYNGKNDNNSAATYNNTNANNQFLPATKILEGRDAKLLDAFAWGKSDVGNDMNIKGRIGQHALLYGESLFFGSNAVAAAQQPIDIIKAASVPNTQFKELLLPVPQVSGQLQINQNLAVGGYYQFAWQGNRLPAADSYFGVSDSVGAGGHVVTVANTPGGPIYFERSPDWKGQDYGQGGMQIRWRPDNLNTDFGFYAARYNSKDFQIYIYPKGAAPVGPGQFGDYREVFPNGIQVYGASASTTVGVANVAGEISTRHNMPLVATGGAVVASGSNNTTNNPAYPVGDSLHANLNVIDILPENVIWDTASLVGEIAANRLMDVTSNKANLDPTDTHNAIAMRAVLEPSFYQVLNNLDISIPVGLG